MTHFKYTGDNQYINFDNVDVLRTNDKDDWVQVVFTNGSTLVVDRQHIEDLISSNAPEAVEPEVSELEVSEPEVDKPEAIEPEATKKK